VSNGLSAVPHSTVTGSRDGVYMCCEGCDSLLRFLIRSKDGRDLCKRCIDGRGERA
jgi:hypothetical protein